MKAAGTAYDKREAPWCGTRWAIANDPCDTAAGMAASVRSYKRLWSTEANVIAAFIENVKAIRFPAAFDQQAMALIAAADAYRAQVAKTAKATRFPQIEQLGLMTDGLQLTAQSIADTLRRELGLPAIRKPYPKSAPWRYVDWVF